MKRHAPTILLLFLFLPWIYPQASGNSLDSLIIRRFTDTNGRPVHEIIVPGKPPVNFRAPVAQPPKSAVILSDVPAFSWSFGCSATAAAMAAGFYDNHGFPNMYTGPTNGGVMPMSNAGWGSAVINGETRDLCPLSATRLGLDGRSTRGHVDDYWIQTDNMDPDPYITNSWPQHPHADCTGDFMGTSQSAVGMADGATVFFYYPDGGPIYDYSGSEPGSRDGCHGLRLFYESRGYTVVQNYTQLIPGASGNTTGFTFAMYRNEIDHGRPVLVQLGGHTILGLGYDETDSTVYLHDTWDHNLHSMTWGGSYSGLGQWGVTVVELSSQPNLPIANFTATPTTVVTGNTVSFTDVSSGYPASWQWSFTGGTPATSSQQNPVVTYNTPGTYQVSLTVTNANGSDTETKIGYITVSDPWYCSASGVCDEYISQVAFGSINNSSSCSTNGYANYTGISANLVAGQTYALTVTNGNPVYPDDQCGVWIDWNHDFDFSDPGESYAPSGTPGSGPYTLAITVPADATPGSTVLRIRILYTGTVSPCGQAEWGETEDYTLNVLPSASSKVLQMKVLLEGLYDEQTGTMNKVKDENGDRFTGSIADQITVGLANAAPPHSIAGQASAVNLDQNGTAVATFSSSLGGNYYIVIGHRNSIETWSSAPVSFAGTVMNYNFTDSPSKAFGNNLVLKTGKYCIYGGDANHDGNADSGDFINVDNDLAAFIHGYVATDINGDGSVDPDDFTILETNNAAFVHVVAP